MKLCKRIIILLTFLAACNSNKTGKQETEQEKTELIEFPEFNSLFSNKSTLNVTDRGDGTFKLDSTQYLNWTDKYTPFKIGNGRIYSAEL